MRSFILLTWAILASGLQAAGLPYLPVLELADVLERHSEKDPTATLYIKISHSEPDDARPFEIAVFHAEGRIPFKIREDGSFDLPAIPERLQGKATIVHTLERGALALSVGLGVKSKAEDPEQSTLALLQELKKDFATQTEGLWEPISVLWPACNDLQIVIVGLTFTNNGEKDGKIHLRKDGKRVKTFDFAETDAPYWDIVEFPVTEYGNESEGFGDSMSLGMDFDVRMLSSSIKDVRGFKLFERKVGR